MFGPADTGRVGLSSSCDANAPTFLMSTIYYTLPPRTRRYKLIFAHDLMFAALSLPVAGLLRASGGGLLEGDWESLRAFFETSVYTTPVFVVIASCVFHAFGMSRGLWRYFSLSDFVVVVKGVTMAVLLMMPALFMIDRLNPMPRSVPLLQWVFLVVTLTGSRLIYGWPPPPRRSARRQGRPSDLEAALLVGEGDSVFAAIDAGRAHPSPYTIVGILDPRPGHVGRSICQVPIVGLPNDLERVVATLGIHGVHLRRLLIASTELKLSSDIRTQIYAAAARLDLRIEDVADSPRLAEFASLPRGGDPEGVVPSATFKRALDIGIALVLLTATLPLVGLAAVVVYLGLGSPVIFPQVRPGWQMRSFTVYKFRTLLDPGRVAVGFGDDARETKIGQMLRRTRLDELPQIWNVLRGDMSLIGPRPLLAKDLPDDGAALAERCSVRPGITGWAQVNGGHLLSPGEKLALDLWYIRQRTFRLDVKILWLTLRMMALGERVNTEVVRDALRFAPAE
jgi:lipopolysaccharide/colanic/teichoic acid biosynthesis glycosyltransferase